MKIASKQERDTFRNYEMRKTTRNQFDPNDPDHKQAYADLLDPTLENQQAYSNLLNPESDDDDEDMPATPPNIFEQSQAEKSALSALDINNTKADQGSMANIISSIQPPIMQSSGTRANEVEIAKKILDKVCETKRKVNPLDSITSICGAQLKDARFNTNMQDQNYDFEDLIQSQFRDVGEMKAPKPEPIPIEA